MFHGIDKNAPVLPVVDFMTNTGHPFYLTGSRFFGTAKPGSDWDFFAPYTQGICNALRTLGFVELTHSSSSYNDQDTRAVFRYVSPEISIDVQLVNDADRKQRIQEIIKHHPGFRDLMTKLPKEKRTTFWNLLLMVSQPEWFNRDCLQQPFNSTVGDKQIRSLMNQVMV